jgi:ribose transport system ATP-binding protein
MGAGDPVIALASERLTKSYGATQALRGVDLTLERGRIHAVLGHNGSGKSTLIRILAGIEHADEGRIRAGGREIDAAHMTPATAHRLGLRFVHQNPALFRELSVAENLALGAVRYPTRRVGGAIAWPRLRRTATELLERFHVAADPDQPLGSLSPAAQTMVAIARALADSDVEHDRVLVLDEPTAALPVAEVRVLLDALRRYAEAGEAILYVTQRLHEIDAGFDRVTVLRNGAIAAEASGRELHGAALDELVAGRELVSAPRPLGVRAPDRGAADAVDALLRLDGLAVGTLRDVSLALRAGEVLGIAGLTGSGRTTLLKTVFGAHAPARGTMLLAGAPYAPASPREAIAAGVGLVPEDRPGEATFLDMTLVENAGAGAERRWWRNGRMLHRQERAAVGEMLAELSVQPAEGEALLGALSGGNQQKVVFGRWFMRRPRLLLLDEPTQGVDVGVRSQIHEVVAQEAARGTGVLFVSSDFHELAQVCGRVLVLAHGRVAHELAGDALSSSALSALTTDIDDEGVAA